MDRPVFQATTQLEGQEDTRECPCLSHTAYLKTSVPFSVMTTLIPHGWFSLCGAVSGIQRLGGAVGVGKQSSRIGQISLLGYWVRLLTSPGLLTPFMVMKRAFWVHHRNRKGDLYKGSTPVSGSCTGSVSGIVFLHLLHTFLVQLHQTHSGSALTESSQPPTWVGS